MHSAATPIASDTSDKLPAARIDAQDVSFVLPIREYLEMHGIQVSINKSVSSEAIYHIVIGDNDFVKDICVHTEKSGGALLAIIVGYEWKEPQTPVRNGKIIYIDAKEILSSTITDIFEFFFTSEKNELDLRRHTHTRSIHEKQPVIVHSPKNTEDKQRIGQIMKDVFGENKKSPPRRKRKTRQWGMGIIIGAGIVLLPVFWYLVSVTAAGVALAASMRSIADGNMKAASWQSGIARYWIRQGSLVLSIASVPVRWLGVDSPIRGQERLISFFSDTASAGDDIRSMMDVGQSVASGFLNQVDVTGTGTTPAADITKLRRSLASVQNTLGLAQAQLSLLLKDRTFPFSISRVARKGTDISTEISTLRNFASDMDEIISLFLQLAGFKEPRSYLILLQNSNELRPTGGFIGSVAVASFEDGRMTDLAIQDVYTFDGQLKGHVDPPAPVRELLDQEHWYLRDSNWDPDFAASAARAAWFYQKESGSNVDGVFAVNTPLIVDILKATGPIDLPDYNDRVTADNFYGKSLYYTQNEFFPGSTQKKDFLGTLARALMTQITTSKTTDMPALFTAVTRALTSHDIMLMFGMPELQSVITHFGWAGRVPSTDGCLGVTDGTCTMDPLIVVEANMGVNKVNYFISRTTDRQVSIDGGGMISETITQTIKNTSGQNQGEAYRTYLRLILTDDVSDIKISVDGKEIPMRKNKTKTPVLPYAERTDDTSRSYVLGIALTIPAGSQTQISVTYTRKNKLRFGVSGAILDLYVQKQPGVSETPVHTVVRYPPHWTAGLEGQDFIANAGQFEYNTLLDRDTITRIRFTK